MKQLRAILCVLATGTAAAQAQIVPGKYIVELAATPATGRAAIRTRQQEMRPQIERMGGHVRASLQTVGNLLVVEIPDGDAPLLRSLAGVARVHPVRLLQPLLDRALPLHKVPEAWMAIGGAANAGAGVKIAILDSGIDQNHAGFQDPALAMPPGFPLANQPKDLAYTNNKVIVARNYVALATPQDAFGHGTAVAMEAAGAANTGPLGTITGMAPKAWLGSYKVYQDDAPFAEDTVLRALEDAVNDGMDVINLSLGTPLAGRLEDDVLAAAVERTSALGVIVCVAAGNFGAEPNTISSPATAPSAIAAGASYNDRAFAPGLVTVPGAGSYYAIPASNGGTPAAPVAAGMVDVAGFDGTGEACAALPPGQLAGSIALIARSPQTGGCAFGYKLNNARNAGAIAAIVYMNADSPALVGMDVLGATLPAVSIDYAAGMEIRRSLQTGAGSASVRFTTSALAQDPGVVAPFSSRGPNVDGGIKPDLLATGVFLYTATEKTNAASFLYGASGYLKEADGTSFATPLVTGAAALLKAARPGLTAAQYRSLLVNSAAPLDAVAVQLGGAGSLDVAAAVRGTVAVSPASLSFGAGAGVVDAVRNLTITNLGTAADTFTIFAAAPAPGVLLAFDSTSLLIPAGASRQVSLRLSAPAPDSGERGTIADGNGSNREGVAALRLASTQVSMRHARVRAPQVLDEYEGYVHIRGSQTGVDTVVPYWYGRGDGVPRQITALVSPAAAGTGTLQDIYFRVTDRSGLPAANARPAMQVAGPLGSVLAVLSADDEWPGVFHAVVLTGPAEGPNVFQIDAGTVSRRITIQGVRE